MAVNMGFLPTIKCSNCGHDVDIVSMAEHECDGAAVSPVLAPPTPPLSADLDSPEKSETYMPAKLGRSAMPHRIDPSVANRPFLQPNVPTPASSIESHIPSPLSISPQPGSSEVATDAINLDSVLSFPMPGNRSPTLVGTRGLYSDSPPENVRLSSSLPHQRTDSLASHSSYRTSSASTQHGSSTARSSTTSFSRGFRSIMEDDTPPVPPAPLRTPKDSFPRDSNLSVGSRNGRGETYSGFDFGITADIPLGSLHDSPAEKCLTEQSRDEGHDSPPSQHSLHHSPTESGIDAPRRESDASSERLSITSFARTLGLEDHIPKTESSISSDSSPSDSSPSRTRSGSSMSSLPSDFSLNQDKTSDTSDLSPLAEEAPLKTRLTVLEVPNQAQSAGVPPIPAVFFSPDSPTDPTINQGGLSLVVEKREQRSLIEPPLEPSSPRRPMQRSATAPIPRPQSRSTTRSKGQCKGCGEEITGKSISSSDGRLTGRYHRGCFVCFECHSSFPTADFYVLNNRPYCAQHYHERNGSLCSTCHTGIEGQYLETVGRDPRQVNRRRFHPTCLQCRTCHVLLNGDYFEWNGEVFCERDARRAAAASYGPPPHGRRRPTIGASPLSQSRRYPPPGQGQPHPSSLAPDQGLRPGPRNPPPGGAKRFPERRTTRLMMI
ncbi:hypothetical protein N7495_004925 [Penicillium taxi]|uniref:uncharacterized protein n=1 Tax=Penicillium taxi TaxID=168475 RepID=UPI0025451942|nr:uncharacterized protein N7495_004925 [Penicillium taxi]KAJ5893234.1 hypothetical protein N7495_004925 [Penicillium taxi]